MVTFTCQNCNSSLKKKNVETHLYKCREPVLTCIDCLKDFDKGTYGGHMSCVTESERYGGKNYTPPVSMVKQQQWSQCVGKVLESGLKGQPQHICDMISFSNDYPNCPRNKKKFINFIMNNKKFLKLQSAAEKAFDLINEEFKKIQDNATNEVENSGTNNNSDPTSRKIGEKRKKISETSEDVDVHTMDQVTTKKKNKKNKREEHKGDEDVKVNGTSKTTKKKKRNESSSCENGDELHDETSYDSGIVNGTDKKKGKKKLNGTVNEISFSETNVPVEEVTQTEENSEASAPELKLSKKERKKLLKQKKYEAEIESIENFKKEEILDEAEENGGALEKKKKKKKKHGEMEETEQGGKMDTKTSISETNQEEGCENDDVSTEPRKKFKWEDVILEVLNGASDGEMSLKRLSKKVCGEYCNLAESSGKEVDLGEISHKFNKKIVKIPRVRVFKDKAKLIETI